MAPEFINPDTYSGKHTVAFSSATYRVSVYVAGELAAMFSEGEPVVLFVSFGYVRGVEHFARTRFLPDGDGRLFGYDPDGALKIIHPANRKLRILTGK